MQLTGLICIKEQSDNREVGEFAKQAYRRMAAHDSRLSFATRAPDSANALPGERAPQSLTE
jgi:hypothetical protein